MKVLKLLRSIGFLILLSMPCVVCAKILIITHSYNRPDFIEWQCKTFEKFLQDDYEFVVFNDASNPELNQKIRDTCIKCGIQCVRMPQELHPYAIANSRHQDSIHYSLNTIGFKYDGIVCMLDSDMFIIKPFSIKRFMEGCDIAAVPQQYPNDVFYLFPGLVFMDMRSMPNKETIDWHWQYINGIGTDTGGRTHYYLKNNPTLRLKHIKTVRVRADVVCDECKRVGSLICGHLKDCIDNYPSWDLEAVNSLDAASEKLMKRQPVGDLEFLLDNHFFHYRRASWESEQDSRDKRDLINEYFNNLIKNNG